MIKRATIVFETVSGSVYEIDTLGRRIRRLEGSHEPTPRQGEDGEWREYQSISEVDEGKAVLIVWRYEGDIAKSTITSDVFRLIE